MSFSSQPKGEYRDRFARNPIENSLPPRLRSNFRGRGHQNRRQNYRQLVIDFNHKSIDSQMSQTKGILKSYLKDFSTDI